jgi:hypothetical protein
MHKRDFINLYAIELQQDAVAFRDRRFAPAYEALEAAMYCALRLSDEARLLEVQELAEEQGQWIDLHAPEHPLSTRQSQAKATEPLFASLARQTRLRILELRVANDLGAPPPVELPTAILP